MNNLVRTTELQAALPVPLNAGELRYCVSILVSRYMLAAVDGVEAQLSEECDSMLAVRSALEGGHLDAILELTRRFRDALPEAPVLQLVREEL